MEKKKNKINGTLHLQAFSLLGCAPSGFNLCRDGTLMSLTALGDTAVPGRAGGSRHAAHRLPPEEAGDNGIILARGSPSRKGCEV